MRKQWFTDLFNLHKQSLGTDKILDFHSGSHSNNDSINVIMKRDGGLKTVSITQVTETKGQLKMTYSDLLNHSVKKLEL